MSASELVQSMLSEHRHWWAQMTPLIDREDWERLKPVGTASGATVGMAAAVAWVAREYPERADELARLVQHYIDNGGDDAELFGPFIAQARVGGTP